jgi:hypothetical protein
MNRRRRLLLVAAGLGLAITTVWLGSAKHSPVARRMPGAAAVSSGTGSGASGTAAAASRVRADLAPVEAKAKARTAAIAEIETFAGWLANWRRAGPAAPRATVADGRRKAIARRAAMAQLIVLDPREALARAVPRSLRHQLPPEITAELETPIDTFGRYQVLAMCFGLQHGLFRSALVEGRQFEVYTYGKRLATLTKDRVALHGIALDGALALSEDPYRRLEGPEWAAAGQPARGVAVAVGTTIKTFVSESALASWSEGVQREEAAPGPNIAGTDPTESADNAAVAEAVAAGWTTGEKKVLVIRVDFSDVPGDPRYGSEVHTAAHAQALVDSAVAPYYAQSSYGQTSLTTTVTPQLYRLPRTASDYAVNQANDALHADARAAAAANYDVAAFDRVIVLFSNLSGLPNSKIVYGGLATINRPQVWCNGEFDFRIVTHELGHTYGLFHAGLLQVQDGDPISPTGTVDEYGDDYDTMGGGPINDVHTDFNPQGKTILGWISSSQVQTVTTSGTHRVSRLDNATGTGTLGLKVAKDGAKDYWIGFRRAFETNSYLRNGAYVIWGYHDVQSTGGVIPGYSGSFQSVLLDFGTPGAAPAAGRANDYDAALAVGRTFTDPERAVHFTPTAVGGSAPNEYIDVRVDFGAIGDNHNPAISSLDFPVELRARTDIVLRAAASDPDGDTVTYRWDFGDGVTYPKSPTVTRRWGVGGSATITVDALDGRGGIATRRMDVVVDDPLTQWARRADGLTNQQLTDIVFTRDGFVATANAYNLVLLSRDGVTWHKARSAPAHYPSGIGFGAERYLAVGQRYLDGAWRGSAATSLDGETWTMCATPADMSPLSKVAYGAGRFVAVGQNGRIYSTTDGGAWLTATTGITDRLLAVRYSAGRFVVAGENGRIFSSTDGLNWTNGTPASSTGYFYGVACQNGRWYVSTGYETWSSTDGLSWTKVTAIRWTDGSLLALGNAFGALVGVGYSPKASVTEDGATWSPVVATDQTAATFRAMAEGNGTAVIVGDNGLICQAGIPRMLAPALAGSTPTSVKAGEAVELTVSATGYAKLELLVNGEPVDEISGDATAFRWTPPRLGAFWISVRGTTADGGVMTSSPVQVNAVYPWVQRVAGTGGQYFTDIAFLDGRFFAVGGYALCISSNGAEWTAVTPAQIPYIAGIAGGAHRLVMVGQRYVNGAWTGGAAYSDDGISWQFGTLPAGARALARVAYGNGRFVAVGRAGQAYVSADGTTWSEVTTGIDSDFSAIRFADGWFVAVSANRLLSSPDGVTWTIRTPGTGWLGGVANHAGTWYASSGYETWRSTDATTWIPAYSPSNSGSSGATLASGIGGIFLMGVTNQVHFSTDANSWTTMVPIDDTQVRFSGAVEGNGTMVIVGNKGMIFQLGPLAVQPGVSTQPANRTVAARESVRFAVTAFGTGSLTYAWQMAWPGGGWSDLTESAMFGGVTTPELTVARTLVSMHGAQFRCRVVSALGQAVSRAATLSVTPGRFAADDLDGDGHADPLWRNQTTTDIATADPQTGRFNRLGGESSGWRPIGVGDFDGDGRSEVLWRYGSSAEIATWATTAGYLRLGVEGGWRIFATGDFDGDGRTEPLWRNAATAEIGTWTMAGAYLHLGDESTGWQVIGVGDFDGDGQSEPLWRDTNSLEIATWTMAGAYLRLGAEAAWQVIGVGDFDGDGKAEPLWRDTGGREIGTWTRAGSYVRLGNESTGWTVIGTGDFDGDGKTEPLWRQAATQEVGSWTIAGAYVSFGAETDGWEVMTMVPVITGQPAATWATAGRSATLRVVVRASPAPLLQWQVSTDGSTWADVVDGAEYSGVGTAGLTIANASRAMNGNRYRCVVRNGAGRATSATATLNVSARACVANDLDGDGKTDLLWRYVPLQELGIWNSTGFVHLGTEGTGWVVIGVGDFDADGKMELIWRHSGSGQIATWPSGGGYVPLGTESAWQVIRIGDFDGDGRSELLWRHSGTGQVVTWTQAGAYLELGAETDGWRVIGIADFDGDGRQEPAWRNTNTFEIRTTTIAGETIRLGTEGGGWTVTAFGDVDGDGKAEPFWRHASTLENVTWTRAGGFVRLGTESSGGWHVIAVGDYDGDGKSEPLWQHETTREIASWPTGGGYLPLGTESGNWVIKNH